MEKEYGLILMDLDNTIFDFHKAESTALALAFEELHMAFDPEETPRRYRARSRELWAALERREITLETLRCLRWDGFSSKKEERVQMDQRYVHFLGKQAPLFPGALDSVGRLAQKYPLVAVTNGIAEVQRKRWEKSSVKDYFQNLVISGEVGWVKPDPRIFKAAWEPWREVLAPEQVLMVGDSFSADMVGALACGFHTCMVGSEEIAQEQADQLTYRIKTIQELPDLLDARSCDMAADCTKKAVRL